MSSNRSTPEPSRITVPVIQSRKSSGDKITALTAYDYTFAKLIDAAGIDVILVGDSVGSVVQGGETTLPVTIDEMIYHTKCVTRGVAHALVVGDLPFLSYQVSKETAILSAGRLIKEGGAAAVKLEGGVAVTDTIRFLVSMDIPVMGHIGLTPQSVHRMGGYKVQGRKRSSKKMSDPGSWERIIEDALAVESAGAFSIVLEGVPEELGKVITERLSIPIIGIGAGRYCDGQILVSYDMAGLTTTTSPRFVKRFAELGAELQSAVREYSREVREGKFPATEHTFKASPTTPVKLARVRRP